jgi:hypothetical protein
VLCVSASAADTPKAAYFMIIAYPDGLPIMYYYCAAAAACASPRVYPYVKFQRERRDARLREKVSAKMLASAGF